MKKKKTLGWAKGPPLTMNVSLKWQKSNLKYENDNWSKLEVIICIFI